MRGKDVVYRHGLSRGGITPAYAGKSRSSCRRARRCGDHPRVCGEKKAKGKAVRGLMGSPPRMRGKESKGEGRAWPHGITPAYAGKRPRPSRQAYTSRDHPRVCGEKWCTATSQRKSLGSPPRMRGKDRDHHAKRIRAGITPAYAGKRRVSTTIRETSKDHPRVCGEKTEGLLRCRPPEGSPPRMRGKGQVAGTDALPGRITPAYAGKSAGAFGRPDRTLDHPRVCGEKMRSRQPASRAGGSPPRMRGKVIKSDNNGSQLRITPAYAGKSRLAPLVRGGGWGSPPRMRGKGRGRSFSSCELGITPAYAGKSNFFEDAAP